ncbi:flagellar biosynthesis anti-sigma factor FlgM [Desulfohalovibrio reitneri]|uniref:flagellar biosynthesis anti-sigma factor FlgM n=1 Tax=Desulfohalovibrio reitneri TaxID=1307759 RepID=UPI0004A6CAC1|nr:flagellar biosynthesis anti-sigma factor FlgM [Desulfohalovibrio reitneri]
MHIKNLLIGNTPYETKKVDKPDKPEGAEKTRKADSSGKGDRINLSEEATLRSQAMREAQSAEDVRAEKVAMLKKQISEGTYQPDNQKIAENLVKEDLDLLF